MMGAMNLRRSLSALHAECEALIWAMQCMKTLEYSDVVFATNCSQMVKMVSSSPDEWPAFATHMVGKLAQGARSSPSAVLYVDSSPPT